MAIPHELAVFENEAHFRDRFIIPLLHRLGFSIVVNYHGTREFGRDVIFGEIDRFGHVVYSAMQVKYTASVGQSDSHGLIADARESFGHEFAHPNRQTKEKVGRFYVANAGSIATNARDNFYELLERPLAANSTLLDGLGLLSLDRLAAFNRGAMVKELISGLVVEIRWNRSIRLEQKMAEFQNDGPYPLSRYRLAATIAMLERPVVMKDDFLQTVHEYWHYARTVNQIIDSIDTPLNVPEFQKTRAAVAIDCIGKLNHFASELEKHLANILAGLGTISV